MSEVRENAIQGPRSDSIEAAEWQRLVFVLIQGQTWRQCAEQFSDDEMLVEGFEAASIVRRELAVTSLATDSSECTKYKVSPSLKLESLIERYMLTMVCFASHSKNWPHMRVAEMTPTVTVEACSAQPHTEIQP